MISSSKRVSVEGHLLHQLTLMPVGEVRFAVMFYHGQGDHADRYQEVLHPFTERGGMCVVMDLPGHGWSPGRRGHISDEDLLDRIIASCMEGLGELPLVVAGHSMGGLLALRHLEQSLAGKLRQPQMMWLSSPLLDPIQDRPKWFVRGVRWLASLVPELTIDTHVEEEMCRMVVPVSSQADRSREEVDQRSGAKHSQLGHSRISIGWAVLLVEFAAKVQACVAEVPKSLPILLTQGSADEVCPAEKAQAFIKSLDSERAEYFELDGLLHEPFADERSHLVFAALDEWLDRTLPVVIDPAS